MGANCRTGSSKKEEPVVGFTSFEAMFKPDSPNRLLFELYPYSDHGFSFAKMIQDEEIYDDENVFFYTEKPLNHGYEIPFASLGFSFDACENYCFDRLKNNSDINDKIKITRLFREKSRLYDWAYFANGCRGYCFSYKVKDIIEAISRELSRLEGHFICVYGPERYVLKKQHIVKEDGGCSGPFLSCVQSIFKKHQVFSMNRGFDFVILSDTNFAGGFNSISVRPTSCTVCMKEANEKERVIGMTNIYDLRD